MPSTSLQAWMTTRSTALDEIERAHGSVGGTGPGRRYATQQINQAYAMLLSSQFQGFCRDLHSECVDHLVRAVLPAVMQTALRHEFILHRKLDKGNPNPGNIGADFNRLGVLFWGEVDQLDNRNARRQAKLQALNEWRNAIAHQDFDPAKLGDRTTLTVRQVRGWRNACDALADSFDAVMRQYIGAVVGASPW